MLNPIKTFWPATAAGWMGFGGSAMQLGGSIAKMFASDDGDGLQGKAQKRSIKNHWKTTFKMAKKYGIHPLVAMGISPSSVPMSGTMDPSTGDKLMELGQLIRRLPEDPEKKANVRIKNAQAALLERELKDKTLDGQGDIVREEQLPLDHPSYSRGEQRGEAVQPLEQLYRDDRNLIQAMPSEGAQDYMSESALANIPYQFKKLWRQLFTPTARLSNKKINDLRDRLDDMEEFMRQNGKLRPDEYLTYDDNEGLPRVKRFHGKKAKTLFFNRNKTFKQQPKRYGGMWFRKNYN